MSFSHALKRLRDAADHRQTGILGTKRIIEARDLELLLYHFDRIDVELRNSPAREIVKENERLHASSNAARVAAGYMHADTSAPFAEFLKSQREELERLRADLSRVNTDKFAGHTPGPWGVVQYGIDTYEVFAGAARVNCLNWDTFSLPDAELIAAAPELLAENERLRAEIEDLRNRVAHLEESEADAYLKNQLDGCHPCRGKCMNDRSHDFFDDINDVIHEVRQYDKYSQPVHGAVDAVREIVKENERLKARVAELETDLNAAKKWGELWYFVSDEAPAEFQKIILEWTPARWIGEAHKLMASKRT